MVAQAVASGVAGRSWEQTLADVKTIFPIASAKGEPTWAASILARLEVFEELVLKRREAYDDEAVSRFIYDVIGTGTMTSESVTAALALAFWAQNPKKAAEIAANMGGDTDTIGCMAAAICGAHCGIGGIAAETVEFWKNERPPFRRTGSGRHEDSCSLHALRTKATAMRSIIELIDALDVRKRILIIGSAFVDVIVHVPRLPLSGEDVEGSSRQQVVGGCAYNAADAVAKLGIDFDALIPVGEGMIADRVRETFHARGFTVREFRGIGDNGWCLSFVEPDGERTFVSMSGVEKCFKPEWLDEIDLQCADLIYLSGYQADARNAGFIEALLAEKRPDAQILFDPGPCSGSIPEEMFSAILSANTILKVNAQEAKTLAPSATPREAAAALSLLTAQSVIVTDGARGAYAAQASKVSHLQGFPVHVVDTIGSGDAHAGGVLAGLASGFTLAEAVLLGNAVASWVTAQEGAATAPQAAELRARHLLDI